MVKTYQPLPADGQRMIWNRTDGSAFEAIDVRWDNEAWTITANLPERQADYVLRASPFWQVRQFLLFRDLDQPDLWLGTDGNRRWGEVNGAHRPDLDSMAGIFVDDSLLSLALPILQLDVGLDVGEGAEIPLAHVDTVTLGVTPSVWRFERIGSHRWAIERIAPDPSESPIDGSASDAQASEALANEAGSDREDRHDRDHRHDGVATGIEPISVDRLPARYEFDVDDFGIPIDVDDQCRRAFDDTALGDER